MEILENYFNPKSFVTYVFTEPDNVVSQTEPLPTTVGTVISEVPAELRKDYCTYELTPTTMKNGNNTVYVTVSYDLPFTVSKSYETGTWYYAKIRYNYYICMDDTEPYYPTAEKQEADNYRWAFMGTPHTGFIILNKAAGASRRLAKVGDYALMRDNSDERWELIRNEYGGFNVLRRGSELDYITQFGGSTGQLGFWVDTRGRTDTGGMWQLEDDAPTGSDSLGAEAEGGAYYRIDGRICGKRPTRSGIYIHNGKKVLIT